MVNCLYVLLLLSGYHSAFARHTVAERSTNGQKSSTPTSMLAKNSVDETDQSQRSNVATEPGQDGESTEQVAAQNITMILNTLLQNYDKRLRPDYGGPPVEVGVTIHVSTISAVSEVEMDYTLDMYLRQYWYDTRLAFTGFNESLTIGIDMVKNIWVPDTFFPNEKKSFFHKATTHNGFLRIKPDGQMLRSTRLTVTANCRMNLERFPMDRQNCSLEIESYGYSTRDIRYTWQGGDKAVELAKDINLAQFGVTGHTNYAREIGLSTGNYSRLSAHFTFRRNLGFYLIQIYLPSSLIVIISWVSFWLNREATQARVAIGVTTVLTMTTLMTSTNASMPKVSYVKSIDIYLGTCFVIVFASLLEYAAVGYLLKRAKMKNERTEKISSDNSMMGRPVPFVECNQFTPNHVRPNVSANKSQHRHQNDSKNPQTNAGVGSIWSRRTQGYQNIGTPGYELRAYTTSSENSMKRSFFDSRQSAETLPATCDCDVVMTMEASSEETPLANFRTSKRQLLPSRPKFTTKRRRRFRPSSIDKYSRIFFPVTFITFHIIYWTVYLKALE